MDQMQYDALVAKIGKEATDEIKKRGDALEKDLNEKYDLMMKGQMTKVDFETFKAGEIAGLNTRLAEVEKLNQIVKDQGEKINKLTKDEGEKTQEITLEQFLDGKMEEFTKLRKAGAGFVEYTSEDLRKAGVTSFMRSKVAINQTVGGTVETMAGASITSPYLPGIGGADLEIFDVVRNPNFIINRIDMGRTNQVRLAWINETTYDGTPGMNVLEGGEKPQVSHKFKVEYSEAKKAAAVLIFTEEMEQDLPGLATAIRRMLQQDVLRAFDDAIQTAVIAVARPYEITGLDAKVAYTTLFDAMGALLAQIGFYNFTPNTLALNTVTAWEAQMEKDANGRYNVPPFMARLNSLMIEANKVAVGYGLAGDLTQYKVDIYKDFTIRVGWINDQFIRNMFTVVGELRYHNYISDNRKKAIVYNSLLAVQQKITAGSA